MIEILEIDSRGLLGVKKEEEWIMTPGMWPLQLGG